MAGKRGGKRLVYVNDKLCESFAEGAREASRILNREVKLWEIQRLVKGEKRIFGLMVSATPMPKPRKVQPVRRSDTPLLNYPHGERPCDRGLPREWR